MQLKKILFSLTLMFLVAANCMAQDEKKKDDSPKAKKAAQRQVTNLTKQMMKTFAPAKLTDEQKEKATAIIKKHAPALMAARKAQDKMLTADQKKSRTEAMAKAKEEGVKGNKVAAAGTKAMGLSEEDLKKFNDAKKKVVEVNGKIKEAITALLTDEQKAAMPKAKGKKGKGKKGEGKKKKDKKDKDGADKS